MSNVRIHNQEELIHFGTRNFSQTTFYPFGKGLAFAQTILGKKISHITVDILNEIADKLWGKETEEDKKPSI